MERYLPVLRHLTNSGRAEARNDVLTAAALFWRRNRQMVAIVFDKLVQYQIVDPTDVVRWTFTHGSEVDNRDELNRERPGKRSGKLGAREWDLLKGAVDKANGRVALARRRVTALRKEEDDSRALAKAGDAATTMAVDAETKQEETPADSPALQTAVKAHSTLTSEQKGALSAALEGFVTMLVPVTSQVEPSAAQRVISEDGWNNRATWGDDEWDAWETWAWYRHFCRTYAAYLRGYSTTLGTIAFSKLEGSSDPAAAALQKIWNIAIGAEV